VKRELIEQITKLVVEKLQNTETAAVKKTETKGKGVTFWSHTSNDEYVRPTAAHAETAKTELEPTQELVRLRKHKELPSSVQKNEPTASEEKREKVSSSKQPGIQSPLHPEELEQLMSKTPARIGIGRAGLRPRTETWLKFRFDHAAAVDAVYGEVDEALLKRLDLFTVNTKVTDKEIYIRRPDYGRKLSEEAKETIGEKCKKSPMVQVIVSDGLSSKAVEENLEDVYLSLKQSLTSTGLDVGTPFYIEKGRVAVMDDVGEVLQPKVVVLLIGERPGLISAESLSAYLCYEPRHGTIEADRMVVSNIHKGGIPPVEAGAYLGTVIQKVLKHEASGVSLVQKER
jgi:ethanolamine ammonia-lyase small subunit